MGWGTTSRDRVSVAAESDGEQRLPVRSKLPYLVLAGPVVRRAEPDSVWFWFASSEEITSCAPTITVFDGAGNVQVDGSRRMALQPGLPRIAKLGDQLWVVLVEARPKDLTFGPGWTYGYDLLITTPGRTVHLRDADRAPYPPFDRPTFKIAASGTNRIAHASCRKPGGDGRDAYVPFDEWLASEIAAGVKRARPGAYSDWRPDLRRRRRLPYLPSIQGLVRDLFGYVEELPEKDGKGHSQ